MEYVGFAISAFIYFTVFVLLLIYLFGAFFDKKEFSNHILSLLFLHSLFSIVILVWSLVIMNQNLEITYDLDLDYTVLLFLFIPILIIVEIVDVKIRAKNQYKGFKKFYRFMLPTLTLLIFFAATVFFYFNCHYLLYLTSW